MAHPADFLVKLLLETGQTLEGADVKPNSTRKGRQERERQTVSTALLAWLALISWKG